MVSKRGGHDLDDVVREVDVLQGKDVRYGLVCIAYSVAAGGEGAQAL